MHRNTILEHVKDTMGGEGFQKTSCKLSVKRAAHINNLVITIVFFFCLVLEQFEQEKRLNVVQM